jgi:hypothetical protein
MGTDFVTAADGHCGDCQSSIRIDYAHCEEGKFRITVRTADGMTQKLRLDGEPVMHLARTLNAVLETLNPGWGADLLPSEISPERPE